MVGYRARDIPDGIHLGMPSATLTFIVSLDDGVESADSAAALDDARPNPLVLGGLHTRAPHIRQRPGQAGIQLAVHPLASRALFGVPSAELRSPISRDSRFWVVLWPALPERTARQRRWSDAFDTVATYLTESRRQRSVAPVRSEVVQAWHLLERSQGTNYCKHLGFRVGISSRYLTTLFQREVGRSPKTVAMLMRFQRATSLLALSARRGRVDLAAIAAETGFSDQAHLTHEFVRFTARTATDMAGRGVPKYTRRRTLVRIRV
ncbi:bacterial regulatory helix-turn-helix s, AraC family protein [Mycobacteroides abscessus]|nr:bacterial regulatory helix-turn-helix s, AraC family protein [Mycobacteroides abscessus]